MAEELANFGVVPAWALLTPRAGHVIPQNSVRLPVPSPLDGAGIGIGGRQLPRSRHSGAGAIRLPFDIQRYHLLLPVVLDVAMVLVAVAAGYHPLSRWA